MRDIVIIVVNIVVAAIILKIIYDTHNWPRR